MTDTFFFIKIILQRKKLYGWCLAVFSLSFVFAVIAVWPSSFGLVPSYWNSFISAWASLFASLFTGFVVATVVDAILLEKGLGPIAKLWPMVDHLVRNPPRTLSVTVAALPLEAPSGRKAPGSGEAMALSGAVRALSELGVDKSKIDLSYAKDNGEEDWKKFVDMPVDRLVLGGPIHCKVTEKLLSNIGSLRFHEVDDQWGIYLGGENLTSDARKGEVDYGLIVWHQMLHGTENFWWILLAGLGTHGVIAAGEAITNRQYAQQILERLQRVKSDFSNVAVLVRCACRSEFIVNSIEITRVEKLELP